MEALLNNPKVRMRDPRAVAEKIATLVADGSDNLIVISDFDFTLSRYKDANGEICSSSHGVFDTAAKENDKTLYEKIYAMKEKYRAIETCHRMTVDEKIPYMLEWWNSSHTSVVESKFHKEQLEEIVKRSQIVLREQAFDLFELLEKKNVPLVIFSAGIGTVIEIYLRQQLPQKRIPQNVHLISNMMLFDENGLCIGFSEPLIHVFCKNGSAVRHDDPFFHDFSKFQNVVLMGDSLGDLEMHVGVDRSGVVLKIGFLNHKFETLLDKYLAEGAYDIVLLGDETVDVPMELFNCVSANATKGSSNGSSVSANDEEFPSDVVRAVNVPA